MPDDQKHEIYSIINPSDPYTFRASDDLVAEAVVLLLGDGKYACQRCADGEDIGGMIAFLPKGKAEDYLKEKFGDFGKWLKENKAEVIEALDSVLCMNEGERFTYERALELISDEEASKSFRDEVHDKRRSSMNNIGARAWAYADNFRKAMIKENGPLVITPATSKKVGLKRPEGVLHFPTMKQVEEAVKNKDAELLLTWHRFLESPVTEESRAVLNKIVEEVGEAMKRGRA